MFRLTTLSLLLAAANAAVVVDQGAAGIELLAKFRQWVETHGKQYATEAEELLRWKVWAANHGKWLLRKFVGDARGRQRRNLRRVLLG